MVRATRGIFSGPMTTSATAPIMASFDTSKSNIDQDLDLASTSMGALSAV